MKSPLNHNLRLADRRVTPEAKVRRPIVQKFREWADGAVPVELACGEGEARAGEVEAAVFVEAGEDGWIGDVVCCAAMGEVVVGG